jgi:hypothetical protein
MAVVHAVTQTMKVILKMGGLLIREFDDWVLV